MKLNKMCAQNHLTDAKVISLTNSSDFDRCSLDLGYKTTRKWQFVKEIHPYLYLSQKKISDTAEETVHQPL